MGNTTYTDVLHEDELTSRNNPEKYYEARKIYDEYDPSNQDRDKYEEELKKSVKPPTNIQNNQIEKTLTNTTDTDVLHEDELTYDEAKKIFDQPEIILDNPERYYEAKKILDEYYPSNQDRDKYEEEPKKSAVKRKNPPISPNKKETPKNTNPKDQKKSREDYSEDRPGSGARRNDKQRLTG